MNRRQRRAANSRYGELRKAVSLLSEGAVPSDAKPDRRYLKIQIRPMTIADLIPGYSYSPGLTMLVIEQPTTVAVAGSSWQIPIELPEEFRAPTPENARAAFNIAYSIDPETRALVDHMAARARPWSEVLAAQNLPVEVLGPIVSPRARAAS